MKLKLLALMGIVFAMVGCKAPEAKQAEFEAKVGYAGDWIAERAGLIQVAVQATTHVVLYSTIQDSEERMVVMSRLHDVAFNLNALVEAEQVDPDSVRKALKVKEQYVGDILATVANIYASEYKTLEKNGYANFAIQILSAVSKGVANGTVLK